MQNFRDELDAKSKSTLQAKIIQTQKQTFVTLFNTEVQYVVVVETVKELISAKVSLQEIGIEITSITVHEDISCIRTAKSTPAT